MLFLTCNIHVGFRRIYFRFLKKKKKKLIQNEMLILKAMFLVSDTLRTFGKTVNYFR